MANITFMILSNLINPAGLLVNPLTAELFHLNFDPLEVVSR